MDFALLPRHLLFVCIESEINDPRLLNDTVIKKYIFKESLALF